MDLLSTPTAVARKGFQVNPEVVSAWSPERVGVTAFLLMLLVVLIRSVLNRTWVPWKYFEDMRGERDEAKAEARRYADVVASMTESLKKITATDICKLKGGAV